MIGHRTRDDVAAGYLEPIVDELTRAFDGAYPVADLHREAERAMSELSGSISLEALPEMVTRLVWVRLVTNGAPGVPDQMRATTTGQRA